MSRWVESLRTRTMLLDGAFTALFLLSSAVSAVTVPPPTNVTVSCKNLKTTVSWEYGKEQPQTSFSVNIISSEGTGHVEETTEHHCDLTRYIWKSEDNYMSFHFVTVTAIQGGEKSQPKQSKSFSFNFLKTAQIKCVLDFPPVKLFAGDSGSFVGFQNPFLFYKELKEATKPEKAFFEYIISAENRSECRVDQEMCRYDISFPEDVENKCVTLNGSLYDRKGINYVKFRETDRVCLSQSKDFYEVLLITLLCAFLFIVGVVAVVICRVGAWTMDTNQKKQTEWPKTLKFDLTNTAPEYATVSCEPTDHVVVTCRKNSVHSSLETVSDSVTASDSQPLCGPSYIERRLSEDSSLEQGSEGHETNEDFENKEPNYDRPHVLQQDFGSGDMVDVYMCR